MWLISEPKMISILTSYRHLTHRHMPLGWKLFLAKEYKFTFL